MSPFMHLFHNSGTGINESLNDIKSAPDQIYIRNESTEECLLMLHQISFLNINKWNEWYNVCNKFSLSPTVAHWPKIIHLEKLMKTQ